MALTIVATCPTCGDVDLTARDLTLTLYPELPERNFYIFRCPDCVADVACHASERNVQDLMGRVRIELIEVPAEALEEPVGDPLTVDDLLDLLNVLSAL